MDTKGELNAEKLKEKRLENNVLIVNLLGLILMEQILIWMLKLVKYTIASIHHLKHYYTSL